MKFTRKQQKTIPVIAGSIVVILIAVLGLSGVFNRQDVQAWDVCNRTAGGWHEPDPRILMVAIDPASMSYFADMRVLWPWPRDIWARVIEVASDAGAAGIMFDMMFDDPGIERLNSPARESDQLFADRLAGPLPVAICAFLTPSAIPFPEIPKGLSWDDTSIASYHLNDMTLLLPYQPFRSAYMGLSNSLPDQDGVIRSSPLLYEASGHTFPTLSLKVIETMCGGCEKTKLDKEGRLWLRYYGKGGPEGAFPYISASSLITGSVPADSLRGKILVVGAFAAGLLDFYSTPVADVEHAYPGFEIHATLISNLLQGDGLVPVGAWGVFIITLIAGFIGLLVFRISNTIWLQIVGLILITIIMFFLLVICFNANILFPVTSPLFACYLGVGTRMYFGWRLEGRQRTRLHNLFSRYLDNTVIESMMDSPEELQMIGIKRHATVLFTDMVGFTPISEGLSPEDVVTVLNEYHSEVVEAILSNRGLLDKYVGDAVMAIFGALLVDDQSRHHAAIALLEIHRSVDELTTKRARKKLPVIDVCVGIHTDEVVVGNIGHQRRMDYTAIGAGVNTASRIEGATRMLGTRNLVSDAFCKGLPDSIHRRELGRVVLKGQRKPLTVYEIITDDAHGEWVDDWAEAWRLWRDGKRSEALETWRKLEPILKEDKALPILLTWMATHVNGTKEDDDVRIFTSK